MVEPQKCSLSSPTSLSLYSNLKYGREPFWRQPRFMGNETVASAKTANKATTSLWRVRCKERELITNAGRHMGFTRHGGAGVSRNAAAEIYVLELVGV